MIINWLIRSCYCIKIMKIVFVFCNLCGLLGRIIKSFACFLSFLVCSICWPFVTNFLFSHTSPICTMWFLWTSLFSNRYTKAVWWFEKTLAQIPSPLGEMWEPTVVNLAHAYRKLKYVIYLIRISSILFVSSVCTSFILNFLFYSRRLWYLWFVGLRECSLEFFLFIVFWYSAICFHLQFLSSYWCLWFSLYM